MTDLTGTDKASAAYRGSSEHSAYELSSSMISCLGRNIQRTAGPFAHPTLQLRIAEKARDLLPRCRPKRMPPQCIRKRVHGIPINKTTHIYVSLTLLSKTDASNRPRSLFIGGNAVQAFAFGSYCSTLRKHSTLSKPPTKIKTQTYFKQKTSFETNAQNRRPKKIQKPIFFFCRRLVWRKLFSRTEKEHKTDLPQTTIFPSRHTAPTEHRGVSITAKSALAM